jgi:hypothetical protein
MLLQLVMVMVLMPMLMLMPMLVLVLVLQLTKHLAPGSATAGLQRRSRKLRLCGVANDDNTFAFLLAANSDKCCSDGLRSAPLTPIADCPQAHQEA